MSPSPAPAPATEAQRIARFVAALSLEQVPEALRRQAKAHLLDTLGVAIASSAFDFARAAREGVASLGTGTASSAIGFEGRLPAASAALLNGTLAHGLDYDDTHVAGVYHASAPVLPAALAVGQQVGADGAAVLRAYITGLEIGCRLALAADGGFMRAGFHPTAICGTFGAAAAAAQLLGLDAQRCAWALGLCGSQAAGVLELADSWLKRLHAGWAAHAGVTAAQLAKAGFVGPVTMLEGPAGLYATHARRVPEGDRLPRHDLGSTWRALEIGLKPYPCCGFLHSAVDAAFELRGRFPIDDVERIDCLLAKDLHPLIAAPRADCVRPATAYRALFSVQYVVALVLVKGRVDLAAFHDEPLDDPEVLALAERVHCLDDPDSGFPARFPGEVIVHLRDGSRLARRRLASLGSHEHPLGQDEIVAKFMANATRVIPHDAARSLAARVLDLERETSLDALLDLTRPTPATPAH